MKTHMTLDERVQLTKKEVDHVQKTSKRVAEFQLWRLMENRSDHRSSGKTAFPVICSDALSSMAILPVHRNTALHALGVQLNAFSGGQLVHNDLIRPLWLSLLLEGNGLRRMTVDSGAYASRLMRLFGSVSPLELGEAFITNPWTAYRLGLFPHAQTLIDRAIDSDRSALKLRIQLASQPLDDEMISQINNVANESRIALISSVIAYSAKQSKSMPETAIEELSEWVSVRKTKSVSSVEAPQIAQAINSLNLVHLVKNHVEAIDANMRYLSESVIPEIKSNERRAHIEGNAEFQRSILARRRGDRDAELAALLRAMDLDRGFSTLYYRTAQIFHDRGDARAEMFYEMGLALSPLDYPTANDYGCWLSDSGQQGKLDSWSTLCEALFPEQFSEQSKAGAV